MCRIDPLLMLYRCDMNDILYICYIWKAVYSCCCAFNLFIHFLSNLAYSFSINVETNPQVLSLSLSLSLTCSVLCLSPCLCLRWLFRLSSPLPAEIVLPFPARGQRCYFPFLYVLYYMLILISYRQMHIYIVYSMQFKQFVYSIYSMYLVCIQNIYKIVCCMFSICFSAASK